MTCGTINPGLRWGNDDLQDDFPGKQGLMSLQAGLPFKGRVVGELPHFLRPHPPNMLQGALSGLDTPARQHFPQV